MRIYIGGVGPAVTAGDMEKTFSSLGCVTRVELVRTNGRNFAYMDFEPTSEKTLAKLFSTYNGCTWKGGKLKLEKAKEHYLDCLKREWAEDAKLISETPTDPDLKKDAGNSKIKCLNLEKMQLQIFFPKLRKVKALPFKGTGKHKYSFQRIEVPPLPIHFCDCEEHREASETAVNKHLSSVNSGVHYEREISIMYSVMNKLFEKERNEPTSEKERTLATAEKVAHPTTGDIHKEESDKESEMDADNLVTNIRVGIRDSRKMQLGGQTLAVNQESRVLQSSKNELDHSKANSKKRQNAGPVVASDVTENKKTHLELPVEIFENEFSAILPRSTTLEGHSQEPEVSAELPIRKGQTWLQKCSWKELIGRTGSSSFSISQSQEPDIPAEPPLDKGQTETSAEPPLDEGQTETSAEPPLDEGQTEPSTGASKSMKGQSWLQKSSWKDLVGGTGNSSFRITNVLPGIGKFVPKQPKASMSTTGTLTEAMEIKAQPDGNTTIATLVTQVPLAEKAPANDKMLRKGDRSQADAGGEVQKEKEKAREQNQPKRTVPEVGTSDVCTFMRSAESVKEWSHARAALSRQLSKKRKKINEDDSPESKKGVQSHKRRQKMK